jgi:hypothetical protein
MDYNEFFSKNYFSQFNLFRNSHKKIPKIIFLDFGPKNYIGSFRVIQCKGDYPPYLTVNMSYMEGGYGGGRGYAPT